MEFDNAYGLYVVMWYHHTGQKSHVGRTNRYYGSDVSVTELLLLP